MWIWKLLKDSGRKESWAPIYWPKILIKLHASHVDDCYNRSRQVPSDYLRSDYLLYGNVRPRGCLKKEVVIMLKNLTFCFVLVFFFVGGGGGSHVSQGKRREDKLLPTEYKRGTTENWQPMRRDHYNTMAPHGESGNIHRDKTKILSSISPLPPRVTNTDLSRILEFRCLKILQLESGATHR